MLLPIPELLGADELSRLRELIDPAEWVDGNVTAGHQSRLAKNNLQLAEGQPAAVRAGQMVLDALARSPLFMAAALPLKIFPPLFNAYSGGQSFGTHVDNAVRIGAQGAVRVRSDLSMTVFLENPATYDGGELTVETAFGVQQVKLPAGSAVLYPSSSLHRVEPVTRGRRVASFSGFSRWCAATPPVPHCSISTSRSRLSPNCRTERSRDHPPDRVYITAPAVADA